METANDIFVHYTYPSHLPDVTINESDMHEHLLGLTDGRTIWRKKGMSSALREFVLLHEEEHVKDMSAGEPEIDSRALERLKTQRKLTNDEKNEIHELLGKRWPLIDFDL